MQALDPTPSDLPRTVGHSGERHTEEAIAPPEARVQHTAEIAHTTRGRVRLRIPSAKNDANLLNQIRLTFEGQPGVDAVNVKPGSGSLVIYYDPDHHPDVGSLFRGLGQTDKPAVVPYINTSAVNGAAAPPQGARTKLDDQISEIEQEAEFLAEHSTLARSIVQTVKSLDREIKKATNNNIDLKILAPVGLAGFTFLEIGAAAATPMWVTLVIFSLNHFVELKAHDTGAKPPEAGANGKRG